MATPTIHDDEQRLPDDEPDVNERLLALGERLERDGREALRTARGFEIFAVAALVIALVTLLAVVVKLDANHTVARGIGPMMSHGRTANAAGAQTPAGAVGVSLREFSVTPSSSVGRSGRVTFAVRNTGAIPHEFVVLRTPKPAADLLKGSEADEAGHVGEIGNISPGALKRLTLRLEPGHYALICNLPGHYRAGQHADFTVR